MNTLNEDPTQFEELDKRAYLVGMATDRGEVAATSRWGGPVEIQRLADARRVLEARYLRQDAASSAPASSSRCPTPWRASSRP